MDQCPECEPGHLDLSREAFAEIADPVQASSGSATAWWSTRRCPAR
ncbi:RlpA-like double-psi beta-barrel domain-containing protein [Micromonospora purpureochromogenes]|nr:RlpA-like double-psi beta-barrel domain-containing protein [Micromonospora purpureochromogenes]